MNGAQLIEAFEATTKQMVDVCRAKNSDYAGQGGNVDAFANFEMIEKLSHGAIATEVGMLTRMSDKFSRLISLTTSGESPKVKDESIDDTLLDLANYCILMRIHRACRRGGS